MTYRWQRGGTNLVDQGYISGSTSSTLTLTNVGLPTQLTTMLL